MYRLLYENKKTWARICWRALIYECFIGIEKLTIAFLHDNLVHDLDHIDRSTIWIKYRKFGSKYHSRVSTTTHKPKLIKFSALLACFHTEKILVVFINFEISFIFESVDPLQVFEPNIWYASVWSFTVPTYKYIKNY